MCYCSKCGARLKGTKIKWGPIAWKTSCFFPRIAFTTLTILNIHLRSWENKGSIHISLYFVLMFLWFTISAPCILLGSYLGSKWNWSPSPCKPISQEIPPKWYPSWMVIGGGIEVFLQFWIHAHSTCFYNSINYLIFDLHSLSQHVFVVLYIRHLLLMVINILFATNTINF
jgi:hypothetical protein